MHIKDTVVNLEKKYTCTIGVYAKTETLKEPLCTHNEMRHMPAASCIKLFFAASLLHSLQEKNISFEETLPILSSHFVKGASVLADLALQKMSIRDLLYLLLAHSDTTAQNVLETLTSSEEVNDFIQKNGFLNTQYVPKHASTESSFSATTPYDAVLFMEKVWNKTILGEARNLVLNFLAQSRHTHFGLRYLPTSLNMKNPTITEHYSKAGKIYKTINDTFLVKTTYGILQASIFINNLTLTKNFNSVDNEGILLISSLAQDLFNLWHESFQER